MRAEIEERLDEASEFLDAYEKGTYTGKEAPIMAFHNMLPDFIEDVAQAQFFDLLARIYELNGRFDEIDEKKRPIPKEIPWIYSDDKLEAARAEVRQEGKLKYGSPEFEKEAQRRAFLKLMTQKKTK